MANRRRRKVQDDHDNHDRWLISYADFITLLFAFFVVMYAISSVSEGKYRVLSGSLVNAFKNVSATASMDHMAGPNSSAAAHQLEQQAKSPKVEQERQVARERMSQMALNLQQALGPLLKEGKVRVTEGVQGISVEINASVLFAVGDATLGGSAVSVLRSVAKVLATTEYPITVEGHTDNTPIVTALFPSNWELSVVRASTVVRLFQDAGVSPWRLTATGYGEQRPVATNSTAEGKARNRRVTITIDAPVGPDPISISEHKGDGTVAGGVISPAPAVPPVPGSAPVPVPVPGATGNVVNPAPMPPAAQAPANLPVVVPPAVPATSPQPVARP